ncbi:mandelate racemase/muconate lactonizing enzyme family protein [Sodalis sp. dw_96]|uniref:mandelate racemase/muconate lactonizing enzyme family protein n=1 Tax=Sodalis sp. dw_96 TaxID=2719794 RepID=UPI001BD1C35F|nr:mandelate racemase/muconate lactonizing enzyme family protein [Sodalis sp. dw_96]
MKITHIQTLPLQFLCENVIGDALSTVNKRQAVLVKIETDSGLYGIGEAFTYGSALDVTQCIIEKQFAPALINEDPLNIEWLWQKLFWRSVMHGKRGMVMGAMSGIDIALWDILGKAANLPIYKLLGGFSNKVATYASGGFYAPGKNLTALKKEMETYMAQGYRAVKIKIGRNIDSLTGPLKYMPSQAFGETAAGDLMRVEAVRESIGDSQLYVDMNAAWSAKTVIAHLSELDRLGVSWIEEPTLVDDLEGCVRIVRSLPDRMSLVGFETEQGLGNFNKLIKNCAVDIIQPDIGWTGGFSECKKIAALSQANGRAVSLHSFGSAVHFAASLQMSASLSNVERMESEENNNPLKSDITLTPFIHDEQMNFHLTDAPGLGIELDWNKVEQYAVKS